MNSSGKINYFFRKYPVLRFILEALVVCIVITTVYFINYRRKALPEISSIVPSVGSPGDVVVINGKNFGDIRDMNYVEMAELN